VDTAALVRDSVELVVQVNGKVRGKVSVAAGSDDAVIREAALNEPNVRKHIEGYTLRKAIVVPGRLVNLVVG
jgi:leucyl-tRNA synthetase